MQSIEQPYNEQLYRNAIHSIKDLIYIKPQRNQFSPPTAPTTRRSTHSPTATHTRTPRCAVMGPAIDLHEDKSMPDDVRVADFLQVVGKKLHRAEERASLICEALNLDQLKQSFASACYAFASNPIQHLLCVMLCAGEPHRAQHMYLLLHEDLQHVQRQHLLRAPCRRV
eukprot:6190466-Pleurochrysis_carterae.AAC.2